jgi:hypothetical protein
MRQLKWGTEIGFEWDGKSYCIAVEELYADIIILPVSGKWLKITSIFESCPPQIGGLEEVQPDTRSADPKIRFVGAIALD